MTVFPTRQEKLAHWFRERNSDRFRQGRKFEEDESTLHIHPTIIHTPIIDDRQQRSSDSILLLTIMYSYIPI